MSERPPIGLSSGDGLRRLRAFVQPAMIASSLFLSPNTAVEARKPRVAGSVETKKGAGAYERSEFFRVIPHGEFSPEERARRWKTEMVEWRSGKYRHRDTIRLFEDIGLTFYRVEKGDTVDMIRHKLSSIPRLRYLAGQREKIKSFNISNRELEEGLLIPIPLPNKDRELSDVRFHAFAARAIDGLFHHALYGEAVQEMVRRSGGKDRLVAAMTAIAKQESGGLPLGQFELHRWEPRYNAFSFSLFHVLMDKHGPGIAARRRLNRTEGQLYHPENAGQLFLAFLVEKSREQGSDPARFFPLDKHPTDMAVFYNGTGWRSRNPYYVRNILRYYRESLDIMGHTSGFASNPSAKQRPRQTYAKRRR